MRKGLLIALLLAIAGTMLADGKKSLKDYCNQIDEAIEHSTDYVAAHEKKIGVARHALSLETTAKGKYQLNYQLYELYKSFVSDSAMYFLSKCIALADGLGDTSGAVKCRSLMAIRCSNIGMYDEALDILDSIRPVEIDTLTLGVYYEAYNNVYSELAYYTRLELMKQRYQAKAERYKKLMLETLPETYETCFLRREQDAQGVGKLDLAMAINDQWLKTVEKGSHPYAMVALYRYIEYKLQGDRDQMMFWLVESVLADIRNAAMDQGSMWELANELMLIGEIDKASEYISFTSDCANRYGSRQRNWQIAPLLTHIAKNYKSQSEATTTQLRVMLVAISVLLLLLLGVLFFLHRRNRQLNIARMELKSKNTELHTANQQMAEQTEELSTLNSQLSTLNFDQTKHNLFRTGTVVSEAVSVRPCLDRSLRDIPETNLPQPLHHRHHQRTADSLRPHRACCRQPTHLHHPHQQPRQVAHRTLERLAVSLWREPLLRLLRRRPAPLLPRPLGHPLPVQPRYHTKDVRTPRHPPPHPTHHHLQSPRRYRLARHHPSEKSPSRCRLQASALLSGLSAETRLPA